jgi:hypothetical protein
MAIIGGASVKKETMSCCQFVGFVRQFVGGQQASRQAKCRDDRNGSCAICAVAGRATDNSTDGTTT